MKKIIYIVFSLCSIGFTGSVLLVEHINLFVGLIGFGFTYLCGVATLESLEMKLKDQETAENTYIPTVKAEDIF